MPASPLDRHSPVTIHLEQVDTVLNSPPSHSVGPHKQQHAATAFAAWGTCLSVQWVCRHKELDMFETKNQITRKGVQFEVWAIRSLAVHGGRPPCAGVFITFTTVRLCCWNRYCAQGAVLEMPAAVSRAPDTLRRVWGTTNGDQPLSPECQHCPLDALHVFQGRVWSPGAGTAPGHQAVLQSAW